ncbi:hypothetical protein QZH41_000377 [Actinostola sp. cb2023]|nr:hypothetical protein QZH41_000377 [Actinostola sp. cb2023]
MLVPDYENTTFLVPLSSQVNVSSTEGNPTKCTFPLAHGIPIVLLNSIFSIFGTFGNVLIIVVVLKTPSYLIIIVSYSIILFQITRERVTRKMQPADSRGISRDARMERRVAGTIAIIIVVFSICWFPLVGFYVTMKKGLLRNLSGVPYMWIRTILLLNSSMNFLIYSFRIDHFRSAYKRIIRRWLKQSRAMGHGTTYSTPGTQSHSKQFSTMDKNAGEEV